MSARRLIGAASVFAGAVAVALRVVFSSEPYSAGSGLLIGLDVMLLALVAAVGLTLTRSRWPWWAGLAVLLGGVGLMVPTPRGAWGTGSVAFALAASVAVAVVFIGEPKASSRNPGSVPGRTVALLLGLLALPAVAGASAPGGPEATHWILAAGSVALAWWYGRAHVSGLWIIRLGLPPAVIAAAVTSPPAGALALLVVAGPIVAVVWTKEARLVASPLTPRPSPSYRIPPELAPPEILEAAGLDEQGRPKRPM